MYLYDQYRASFEHCKLLHAVKGEVNSRPCLAVKGTKGIKRREGREKIQGQRERDRVYYLSKKWNERARERER